jgi:hypothetical protein
MSSDSFVRELTGKARRRAVASILTYSEQQFGSRLEPEEWERYREKVLNALGVYHDSIMDVVSTLGDGPAVVNEAVLEALTRLESSQIRMVRALENGRLVRS